jgi:hypothetical protein
MLTLQILLGFFVLGTIGSIILLKDGYKEHAKVLFFQMTLGPIGFILFLILLIGMVPMPR